MALSLQSRIVPALVAFAAMAAAGAANALTSVHVSVGVPAPVQVQPRVVHVPAVQPVHAPAHEVHVHRPVHRAQHWHEPDQRAACRAPRWNPHVRYMPGQVVRRHGELWMARRVSARVWNENSPPEQTPRYWSRAVCG